VETKQKVLLVDDDKFMHKVIAKTLGDRFTLFSAFDGKEGIALAKSNPPDIILLDVEMPELNGYETCERLRADPQTTRIPILFLSSRSSLQERLLGLELGADDYLVKPCSREDIIAKLAAIQRYQQQRGALQAQIELAQKAAYVALAGSSELGRIMLFVEQSYAATNFPLLMTKLLGVTTSLGLNCSVMCHTSDGPLWFALMGEVAPMEQEIISALSTMGRFYDFGCRTQINFPFVSLLIKNMPLDDMERYGRLKDALPFLLSAADSKIRSMNTEQAIKRQSEELAHAFDIIHSTLSVLGESLKENQENGIQIMRRMMMRLMEMLPGMGLDEDQEERLLTLVDGGVNATADVIDNGERFSVAFNEVLVNLDALLKRQQTMVKEVMSQNFAEKEAPEAGAAAGTQEDGVGSVELF
jgi:CheY-like chemotaxis protein